MLLSSLVDKDSSQSKAKSQQRPELFLPKQLNFLDTKRLNSNYCKS